MSLYAMNLNDGRFVFNSPAVATNINYAEVDDETHAAVKGGKLPWQTVANAIKAKRNNDPTFDWSKFDELRERLNVRKAKFVLKDSGGHDVTGVGGDGQEKSVNPKVSFVEIEKADAGGASTADNTNVGGVSHPQKTRPSAPKAVPSSQGVNF